MFSSLPVLAALAGTPLLKEVSVKGTLSAFWLLGGSGKLIQKDEGCLRDV